MGRVNPLESTFQRRVLKYLSALPNCFFYKAQATSLRGIPDIICGINGRFIGLELKRSIKEKPTALQKYTLDKIANANNIAFVVHPENWDDIKPILFNLSTERQSV